MPRVIVEPPPPPPPPEESLEIDSRRFAKIDLVAREEVAAGHVPGAVILVGHRGKTVYRKAFGQCALMPRCQPMKVDSIFDIASLTKVVATTTAVMELVERGQIHLDKPAAAYWPAFAANGKGGITIRQLMTHTSGLRAGVASRPPWSDYDGAMVAIAEDHPVKTPGTQFNYSDVNFITLGEIVHRVSHMPLNVFCKREVFEPLGMKDTSFLPSPALKSRIAPTDFQGNGLRWGVVSDPTSHRMGGVAGHA
ncbi:MAG TPA: serine hydrolase domain-containing protein, partial [Desulfobaccales bacterium]|nr:serine hydrolase domain-containing protein [Desulfobaccales bacterium]